MAFKKKEALIPLVEFETPGQKIVGRVVKVKEGETQYGKAQFAIIEQEDTTLTSFCISSSMALHDWNELVDQTICIVYKGEEKSKKRRGKSFKVFDLFVDDGEPGEDEVEL